MKYSKTNRSNDNDFIFEFSGFRLHVDLNPNMFDSKDVEKINSLVLQIEANPISIDKSYVDFSKTNYEKTFMTEDGWNSLCKIVKLTDFGKTASKDDELLLLESYTGMICCYVDQLFEDLGYDAENMHISVVNEDFKTSYYLDTIKEWKHYKGKWQNW